ncbi:unnamed protein product [Urochloa humidicola]
MGRASVRPIAVAAALHILAALHGAGPSAASARPLATSALAVAPAAAHQRRAAAGGEEDEGGAAAREGKWLPFLGAHHLPEAYKPAPWAGVGGASPELGGAGAMEGGEVEEEGEVVRERGRERRRRHRDRDSSSAAAAAYVGDGGESTRREQLAMWASLLNPKGRGRPAGTEWLPAPGIGEAAAADDEPAKAAAADTAAPVEGAEGEERSAGQSYWGNNGN